MGAGETPALPPRKREGCELRGYRGLFGCGVWVCIVSVGFWVGDGRAGTLVQDDYGTYADAGSIGGVLPNPHTCHWGLAGVEGVPGWGNPSCISARPLSGTAFGSLSSRGTESSDGDYDGAA